MLILLILKKLNYKKHKNNKKRLGKKEVLSIQEPSQYFTSPLGLLIQQYFTSPQVLGNLWTAKRGEANFTLRERMFYKVCGTQKSQYLP